MHVVASEREVLDEPLVAEAVQAFGQLRVAREADYVMDPQSHRRFAIADQEAGRLKDWSTSSPRDWAIAAMMRRITHTASLDVVPLTS